MKRLSLVIALLAALALPARGRAAEGVQVPAAPQGRINDFAGVLSATDRAEMEAQLLYYEQSFREQQKDKGAPQVAVVILPSLKGESLEEVSIRFAERWKIGSKADDGVLLLVATAERSLRIEVGYGAEGRLTDALSGRIIGEIIAPRLKEGDHAGGLRAGLVAIHQALSEQPVTGVGAGGPAAPAAHQRSEAAKAKALGSAISLVLTLLILMLLAWKGGRLGGFLSGVLFHSLMSGRRSGGFGGGGGGGGFSGGGGSFGGGGASGRY